MKILIVEDDFVARKLMNTYLASLGKVDVAGNGAEAISAVEVALKDNEPYTLICLDVMMPKVDGLHALSKIRSLEDQQGLSKENRSKIIMTTALSDKDSVVAAVKAECDAYIIKPITKSRLFDEIQKLVFKAQE